MKQFESTRFWESPGTDQKSTVVVTETDFAISDRMLRSSKMLVVFWLFAAVSAPIPVVHMFTVPGFVLLGLVVAIRRFLLVEVSSHAQGVCPACSVDVSLKLNNSARSYPRWEFCPECNARLHLQ